jgi:hypothetical protein
MTAVPPVILVAAAPAQLLSHVVMPATDPMLLMPLLCGVLTRTLLSLPPPRQTEGTNLCPVKLLILVVLISALLLGDAQCRTWLLAAPLSRGLH